MRTQPLAPLLVGTLVLAACADDRAPLSADSRPLLDLSATLAPPIVVGGFATPESAVHDEAADVYLVSNINGHPQVAANNGFISRVDPDGTIADPTWIAGGQNGVTLHAPKGMVLLGDILYVSDVDGVRLFDRVTGAALDHWPATGSLLNDVCAGPDGTIYQTDSGLDITAEGIFSSGTAAIYRFRNGVAEAIATGPQLGHPNGCWAVGANVHVVTFGDDRIYRINPSGRQFEIASLPTGGLDGIVRVGGSFYVSSWDGSAVYRTGLSGGRVTTVLSDLTTPADLGYDAVRDRLLIPLFGTDEFVIQPLR
jgi:sugar lactone lactonase YvrE